MTKTHNAVTKSKEEILFSIMLSFYPDSYRKRFGREMMYVFQDLCQQEIADNGTLSVGFWFSIMTDSLLSIVTQHLNEMGKKGIKKYFRQTWHVNKYNIIGFIFLLPFLLMFAVDFISRVAQGDLIHYNRPVYHYLSGTPLYWTPVLFTIVVVLPILALVINVVQIFLNKSKKSFSLGFMRRNLISAVIICVALGCISIVEFHDFLPCMVHGILSGKLTQFSRLLSFCHNA